MHLTRMIDLVSNHRKIKSLEFMKPETFELALEALKVVRDKIGEAQKRHPHLIVLIYFEEAQFGKNAPSSSRA